MRHLKLSMFDRQFWKDYGIDPGLGQRNDDGTTRRGDAADRPPDVAGCKLPFQGKVTQATPSARNKNGGRAIQDIATSGTPQGFTV